MIGIEFWGVLSKIHKGTIKGILLGYLGRFQGLQLNLFGPFRALGHLSLLRA